MTTINNTRRNSSNTTNNHEITLKILRGDFSKINNLSIPKRKLEIFVSSTFTDTHFERNILHEIILPKLQEKYRKNNITILFSDLRFGIKDENSNDHSLWELCSQEIQRCYQSSNGFFFLSLQGDKYGYRPLPKILPGETFAIIQEKLIKEGRQSYLDVLLRWYLPNENTIPTRYELIPLIHEKERTLFYSSDLEILRQHILKDLCINNSSNIITINRSITEWETSLALRLNPQSCYWIHKTLTGKDSLSKTDGLLYHDCISVEDQQKLTALKREMKNKISTENVFSFNVSIAEYRSLLHESEHDLPDASSPPQTTATANNYYEKWKKVVTEVLEKELNRIVLEREQWEMKGFECLLPGKYIEEIFHHAKMVEDKSTVFIGRNHLLQECEKIIDNGVPLYDRLQFKAISLALIGKSGSGKTALMAMLAKHYYHRYTSNIPIIIRFCGTSQYSVHAMDLIQSISMQILQIYEENDRLSHYLLKMNTFTYNEAVLEFHSIVKAFPAFIFIDSLDQLSNRNEARSRLSFLRDLKIHNRSKLIVSCLPDEFDQTSQTWIYCYYCETRLIEGNVPAVQVPTFAADISSSSTQIEAIHRLLEQLLSLQHRRLTTNQMNIATQSILQEPTILYFNLALKVLKEWKSTETNCLLAPNVKDLVHQIFRSIEINYGEKLVRTAFSLITYTRAGINDLEMQDLLSLDDNVLEEVFQYSAPSRIKRLPIHVWYRLRNVLKDLTVEKTFHCIAWYHRQLWEAAEQRYAGEKIRIHRLLASYFSNKVDSFLMRTRLITNHPLTLNDVSIWSFQAKLNERKIIESSYHFIQGGMISQAIDHFCDIEMIYASTLQQDGFYFLTLFTELKQLLLHGDSNGLNPSLQITAEQQRRVNDYYVWLSKEMRNIQRDPKQFLLATARSEPRVSNVWKDLSALLHRLRDEVEQRSQQDPLLNLKKEMNYFIDVITLNGKSDFESVLLDGTEHTDFIKSVRWNADSSLIATGSSDKTVKVWNSLTGEVLHTLSGHRSFVSVVRWHPQLLILATGSWDHSIKIWDATTGRLLHDIEGSDTMVEKYNQIPKGDNLLATMDDGLLGEISKKTRYWHGGLTFHGHSEAVVCIEWHHQGKFLLSLSKDRHIKCWNPLTWTPFFTLYKKEAVECLSLNHTSSHFVTRTDSSIQIWKLSDFEKGEIPLLFQELTNVNCIDDGKRNSIAWSADDQMIASGCNDGCVKIWEFNPFSAKFIQRTLFRGHQSHVYSVVWASDNLRLASGGEDKRVLVWNHQTLEILQIFTNHFDFISDLSLNHSDRILASVSYDKTLKLWDIETISSSSRPTLIRASSSERNCICGHQDEVLSIGFCPLSESLYSVSLDGLMIEWESSSDVIKNQFILKKSGFRHFIRFNAPMIWSFVPPQPPLFAYVENELIVVWDLSRGVGGKLFQLRLPDEFKYTRGEIKSIAWNTQRTVVSAVVDGSFTTSIHIWDISALLLTPTPTTLYDFHYPTHRLIGNFMQWHPLQLNCSVVIARNAIQIMDTQHEKVSRSNASVYSFMFVIWNKSGDAFAAISTSGEIFIISSSTLQIITRFQDQLPIQQTSLETSHPAAAHHYQLGEMYVDWNMKGDRLVSTANHSHNHYLCVWDVNEGKLLVRLFGHKSFITSVLWISDHRIASSSKDHTIKVWEVIENT